MKGWGYHALPVTGAILIAVAVQLVTRGSGRLIRHSAGILILVFAVLVGLRQGGYYNWYRADTYPLLRTVPRGEPVAIIAEDPMFTWPTIEELGLRWSMRLYSYWMLPAIGDLAPRPSNPALTRPLARTILRQTLDDLRCDPPVLLLIEKREYSLQWPGRTFDVGRFFLSDPALAAFVDRHYTRLNGTSRFLVYRRWDRPAPVCDGPGAP
jgi:hypothetical protein